MNQQQDLNTKSPFNQLTDLTEYESQTIYIDNLDQEALNNPAKYLILNIGMGGGKTLQTINYLKSAHKKFLFVTPNQALASNIYTRLIEADIEVIHYKDHKKELNTTSSNLVICLNSLHYLENNIFDIIILDEIETTLNCWYDNSNLKAESEKANQSWQIFKSLIINSEKTIFLDAFLTKITTDFIKSIDPNNMFFIIKKSNEISDRKMRILPTLNNWINGIICKLTKLNKGKRCFIYYPYKQSNQFYDMKELNQLIVEKTGKTGIYYNSLVDEDILKTLIDVNKSWSEVDFIITNNKITVGVSYDQIGHFDSTFIALAPFSSPRDVIQSSCRVRNISSSTVYVAFIKPNLTYKQSISDETNNKKIIHNDAVYDSLIENLKIEKKAPIYSTFMQFCNLAGYDVIV